MGRPCYDFCADNKKFVWDEIVCEAIEWPCEAPMASIAALLASECQLLGTGGLSYLFGYFIRSTP